MELDQRLQYLSTPNRETLSNKWFLEWHGLVLQAEACSGYSPKGLCLLSRFYDATESLVPTLTEAQRLVTMVKKEGGKTYTFVVKSFAFRASMLCLKERFRTMMHLVLSKDDRRAMERPIATLKT